MSGRWYRSCEPTIIIGFRAANTTSAKDSLPPTERRLPSVKLESPWANPIQPRPDAEPTTSGPEPTSQNFGMTSHFAFAATDAAAPVEAPLPLPLEGTRSIDHTHRAAVKVHL